MKNASYRRGFADGQDQAAAEVTRWLAEEKTKTAALLAALETLALCGMTDGALDNARAAIRQAKGESA